MRHQVTCYASSADGQDVYKIVLEKMDMVRQAGFVRCAPLLLGHCMRHQVLRYTADVAFLTSLPGVARWRRQDLLQFMAESGPITGGHINRLPLPLARSILYQAGGHAYDCIVMHTITQRGIVLWG
jgi:hypothetical protein